MRERNSLYEKGSEVTLGLIVIAVLFSMFIAGLVVLYLAKNDKFKIDDDNLTIRIVKCLTISSGVSLLILFSSGAGYMLAEIFSNTPQHVRIGITFHIESLVPTAVSFGLELFATLFFADFITRHIEPRLTSESRWLRIVSMNSLRISMYLSFTAFASLIFNIFRTNNGIMDFISGIIIDPIRSTVYPVIIIIDLISIAIYDPIQLLNIGFRYSVAYMPNVFAWTPFVVTCAMLITIYKVVREFLGNRQPA
ncbi:MAG: hypothetical protein OEL76_16625 [Siculibacillus sp.]|nr:hypothetical protein [Siculibacillus sp.]